MPLQRFHPAVQAWFQRTFPAPTAAQAAAWPAIQQRRHTLVAAPTGSGKTLTAFLAALDGLVRCGLECGGLPDETAVVYVSPLKALSNDIRLNLEAPLAGIRDELVRLGLPDVHIRTAVRTGDTPASERQRALRKPPHIFVTTPESLYVLLGSVSGRRMLATVHTVIVDEWHELMGTKRGVQVELGLARLKRWNPGLAVWGLSATLGNLDEAMRVLLGHERGRSVRGRVDKSLVIDTLLPANPGRFSWGGHLGKQMQMPVVDEIERSATTLVFVNMRSQAEAWYQFILDARPDWAGLVALHHGEIKVASRGIDQGTRVTIRVPEAAPPPASDVQEPAAASEIPPLRILLVDDNEDQTAMLQTLLELAGHNVAVASDGTSGLALAREFRPEVAILDIGLPGMSGHEVARAFRADPALEKVLLIAQTGWGQASDRAAGAAAGFDVHLVKPVSFEQLETVLRERTNGADT